MSSRIFADTAITRSADSTAVFSIQDESRYPLPSWSAFHGRSGSMLWSVTTSGMRWSVRIQSPPMSAYHVCACTTSASTPSRAIARSIDSVSSAGAKSGVPSLSAFRRSHGVYPRTVTGPEEGSRVPKHRTSTAIRFERAWVS